MLKPRFVIRKWAELFMFPLVLLIIISLWVHFDYYGPFQSNFNGGFYRLSKLGPNPCNEDTKSCMNIYEKETDVKTALNLLVGDSEAESIRDLFESSFLPTGTVISRSGCPFINFKVENVQKECASLNYERFRFIASLEQSTIYIFNHNVDFDDVQLEHLKKQLIKMITDGNKVVYILPPAEIKGNFGAYALLLFKTPIGTPRSFVYNDFKIENFKSNERIKSIIASINSKSISYVDVNPLLCPNYPCEITDSEGEYLYQDSTHLSAFGGLILMDSILSSAKN